MNEMLSQLLEYADNFIKENEAELEKMSEAQQYLETIRIAGMEALYEALAEYVEKQ